MNESGLVALYIFGSMARGEFDDRSDLDILAVVRDGAGKVEYERVSELLSDEYRGYDVSVSWYGVSRLREMFANGELFAWHLHRETIPILENESIIVDLGVPAPYSGAIEDVASFRTILRGVPSQLAAAPQNGIYEIGLIYVCLRNIAMAASWSLAPKPDFTRYSPFNLTGVSPVPITRDEYEIAMACRMAGQRGMVLPPLANPQLGNDMYGRIAPWLDELYGVLRSEKRNG